MQHLLILPVVHTSRRITCFPPRTAPLHTFPSPYIYCILNSLDSLIFMPPKLTPPPFISLYLSITYSQSPPPLPSLLLSLRPPLVPCLCSIPRGGGLCPCQDPRPKRGSNPLVALTPKTKLGRFLVRRGEVYSNKLECPFTQTNHRRASPTPFLSLGLSLAVLKIDLPEPCKSRWNSYRLNIYWGMNASIELLRRKILNLAIVIATVERSILLSSKFPSCTR